MKLRLSASLLALVSLPTFAADAAPLTSMRASQRDANTPSEIEAGAFLGFGPGYLGASKTIGMVGPYFEANFGNGVFLSTLDGLGYRSQNHNGFSFAASLGGSMARNESSGKFDTPNRLLGMGNIGLVPQLNLFANYDMGALHLVSVLQQELGNRHGLELQLGGLYDVNATEHDLVQLHAGFAAVNQAKMQTFFGVTPSQSANSGNAVYTPSAGVAGAQVGVNWRHAFSASWTADAGLGLTTLRGSAANSPLTQRQSSVYTGLGIGYRF
ncbi:MAG: MipA/OmpV family protein [Nitrosomonadales bacterium]|nr:MipA/OmpV family protein [Nitrosomonadales bacterium]